MLGRYRFAAAPRWVCGQVVVVALVVTMAVLGRWQLDVSNAKHFALLNFGYALQWWAFALFTVVMWARIMRDVSGRGSAPTVGSQVAEAKAAATAPVAYRRYVMPQMSDGPAPAMDAEHAAYNDYLARLGALPGSDEERTAP
jgi:DNA-binding transcriptional regulator of glucitol operon